MRRIAFLLCLVAGFVGLTAGCRGPRVSPAVTGNAVYLANITLPAGAVARLQLVELNAGGEVLAVVSEQTVRNVRRPPIPFDLPYRKDQIRSRGFYAVQAEIVAEGGLQLRTRRPFPVLTRGNPSTLEVLLEPVR